MKIILFLVVCYFLSPFIIAAENITAVTDSPVTNVSFNPVVNRNGVRIIPQKIHYSNDSIEDFQSLENCRGLNIVNFDSCKITSVVNFAKDTFYDAVSFDRTRFFDNANFHNSLFNKEVVFEGRLFRFDGSF